MATFGESLDAARRLLAAGELSQAEVMLRQLIETAPQAAEPWHELGLLEFKAGRTDTGLASLRQAVTLDPAVSAFRTSLAIAHGMLNQPAEALVHLERALELGPPTFELLNYRATALEQLGQTAAALEAFEDVLRIRPQHAAGHLARGRLLVEAGRLQEAADSYQRAVDLAPSDAANHYNLGVVYWHLDRSTTIPFDPADEQATRTALSQKHSYLTRAVTCFRRALELKPGYARAYGHLMFTTTQLAYLVEAVDGCLRALALAGDGQLEAAATGLEQILASKPEFFEGHHLLGLVREKQKRSTAAIASFRQTIALAPQHIAAYHHLAAQLLDEDRAAEAEAVLRHVLTLEPDSVAARQALERASSRRNQHEGAAASPPQRWLNLQAAERQVHSQNGEDGVIEALFAELGTTNRFFVEFGCGDGRECNGAYLREQGWQGLQMDGREQPADSRAPIQREFVTAENINDLFHKYEVPPDFDLLSIDLDGIDFWVWRQIANYRPRVVVIEYNAKFPPSQRLAIAYDPAFVWTNTDYMGASLLALHELAQRKRYTLVYCDRAGVNAFFVANEVLPANFRPLSIAELYRVSNYWYVGLRHPTDPQRTMTDPFASDQ